MNKRKDAKSVKIRPNLTKNRNNLLFEANDFVANIDQIDFCFANIHGDLNVRMKEEVDGRQIFSFDSMEALRTLLIKKGCIEDAGEEEADVEEWELVSPVVIELVLFLKLCTRRDWVIVFCCNFK